MNGVQTPPADDPLEVFRSWHQAAKRSAPAATARPDAMCLATVDADGSPQARFVDLKGVRADGLVFCTSRLSPKGREMAANARVALTFWWEHVGRQVRVVGEAKLLSDAESDAFFAERSDDARLASWAFEQSARLAAGEGLADMLDRTRARFDNGAIPRPSHWSGYLVRPDRMEFLQFAENRSHYRLLYTMIDGAWRRCELQP